jgi:outer membrane protein insertion porin family
MNAFRISYIFLLLFFASVPVAAQDLKLKAVRFKGNETLSDGELLAQMNTKPKKGFQKLIFWKKRPGFIEAVLEDDINRIRSYYTRNGFLDPRITYATTESSAGAVSVLVTINENRFIRVNKLVLTSPQDTLVTHITRSLKKQIALKQGERFRDKDVFDSEALLKKGLNDNGYPFGSIGHRITVDNENSQCDVELIIIPGERSFFGGLSVKGDSLVPEKFIRKFVQFSTGQVFSAKKISRTQQDIFGSGLFRYVVVTPEKDSIQGNSIPVTIRVKELPGWQLESGIGYGTEDRLRLAAQLTRLYFLGGARKLIVNAKTSYFVPYSLDTRFVQPAVLFPKLDFVLNPFILRQRELSYRIDRFGGGINFLYRHSKTFSGQLSYSFEHDNLLQTGAMLPDSIELRHNKSIFGTGGRIDRSDDPFYPSKGYKLDVNVSYAVPGFGSNLHYYKAEVSLVNYFRLDYELTLATKIKTGVIQSVSRSVITPVEEKFYLGGASSLRGWGRHTISPVSQSGFSLGGNTMLEGSAELRFPVYDIFHGVIFMDAGNAWAQTFRYNPADLHYDAGIGLRIRTPIGPIRLDFASPVINDPFTFQFFISVGNAF